MTKTARITRIVILIFYSFFFLVFILLYKNPINKLIENKYVLIKNVKIDSIYQHRSGRSTSSYKIVFQDDMKKQTIDLQEDTYQNKLIFSRIVMDSARTIDLVKIENCKGFIQCSYKYYQYDNRFICDKNGICQFTEAYKKRQVIILILASIFFIIVTTIIYKLFNSKFVKTL
jgi:hypothetical protein